MQKLIDRKNTDCFPLWRERGTIRQDGWWKVEPSMLERRNVDQCDWYIKSMEQHFLSYIPASAVEYVSLKFWPGIGYYYLPLLHIYSLRYNYTL